MPSLLSKLVAESFEKQSPDADPGVLFEAQKGLEKKIIDEVCSEEVARIDKQVKEQDRKRRFQQGLRELKAVLLQCFLLAFLVGLLVSHVYDAIKGYLYEDNSILGVDPIFIGIGLLCLICFGVAFGMVASKAIEVYKSVMQGNGDE